MATQCPKCNTENPDDSIYCGKCATPLPSAGDVQVSFTKTLLTPIEDLTQGTLFAGRYEIIEELGKGGMGKVYKALDNEIHEEVAVKLLRPEIAANEKIIERFRNELKIARGIAHKNVCKVYHFGKEEDTPYITMEYVAGENLKSRILEKERLKEEDAISIAKQVCEGLAEAHRLGVIHRDLKPQNIMFDQEGQAKIMDFGISRSVEAKGVTETGIIIGTPDYISPEQAEGEEADHRSDIYSLGVILYEMVAGSVPFRGDTALSVALKHKAQLPQDPKKLNPEISDNMSRLILICMEKDKKRRYQTAQDLLNDLRNIEEGLPLGTKIKPKRATFTQSLIQKRLFYPALIVTLAIIAIAIWQLLPQGETVIAPKIENSIAIIGFENQTGDEAFNYLQKLIPNLLITNLENSGLFHVATWERMRDLLKQMDKGDVDIITSDLGFQACHREGIKALALGSYAKVGETFVIDVKVLDVETKRLMKSASSRGEGEGSIFTQIDGLSKRISQGMGMSLQKTEAAKLNISEVTTNSIEAYSNFLKGRETYEKLYYDEARTSLEKAVILDPEFAVAYLYLAKCLRPGETRNEAYEKAKTYSEKATEKERLYIEAAYARTIERNQEKRLRILKQITNKYPKEKRGHFELGYYYLSKRLFDKAIQECNKAIELDPNYGLALNQLAGVYFAMGDFEKAIEYFERYISVSPGDANPLDSIAACYYAMGRLDEAVAKYKEALEVKPDWIYSYWAIGYINALEEDYSEAMKWVDQGIAIAPTPSGKAEGLLLKGFFYFWLGSLDQSLREIRTASLLADSEGANILKSRVDWMEGYVYCEKGEHELARKSWENGLDFNKKHSSTTSYKLKKSILLGRVDLKEGRIDSLKTQLVEIKSLLPKLTPASREYYKPFHDSLHAEVLLTEGSLEEAVVVSKKLAWGFLPSIFWNIAYNNLYLFKDVLARVYRQKGELDKAMAEYERLMTFDPEGEDRRLIHPLYHYRLATLYEQRGWEGKAIDQYEKFLALWKDADETLPEKADAKKKLSALKEK